MIRFKVSVFLVCYLSLAPLNSQGRDVYHAAHYRSRSLPQLFRSDKRSSELEPEYWYEEARRGIEVRAARGGTTGAGGGRARNVVMFLGDGMSVPTLAAARALLGQRDGHTGEEAQLAFEQFPTLGLAKTYCVDAQVADSACSATAYLCGAKANIATIGVDAHVQRGHCTAAADKLHQVQSIATWALQDGRDVGIVTTTRVTHASPAGTYSHTANRDWESDADVAADCGAARAGAETVQEDIALQLVHSYPGNHFKVILGGGRREFLPNDTVDEEGTPGRRVDGRNLIREWENDKRDRNVSFLYAWDKDGLMSSSGLHPNYLLGLFEGSHMHYHLEAEPSTEPTLAELTEIAINSLSRNERGFFLFVEGGRIDHAHHENLAQLALDETIEMSRAVERATSLLSEQDSLVVVTADHAHVMAFNGYTHRGGDILGPSDDVGDDGVPYMTLSYTNGPGFRAHVEEGVRADVTQQDYHDVRFAFPASVPLSSETHGGDDVGVFAWGPQHGMFSGLYEQSQLPHLMAYAACIGPGAHAHACSDAQPNRQ